MTTAADRNFLSDLPLSGRGADRAPAAPATIPAEERSFVARYSLLILLLLTAFAGYIRFRWIELPAMWTDDGHTFRRIDGSFQDMLDIIQSDGFAPLNFEMYWLMGHWLGPANLTPFWMRLVPAACGTLMVPAIYFLARQLTSKRASLLAAAFTACSAYMMVYSQNARMYMPFWLSCVLSVACLLWWLRTNLRVAWLAWIAASLSVGGHHAPGLLLFILYPLFLLTQRGLNWKRALLFIVGFGVIASGPAVFYLGFNRMRDRMEDTSWDSASGLGWAVEVLRDRGGKDLLRSVAGSYLYSWEWPADDYSEPDQPRMWPKRPAGSATSGTGGAVERPSLIASQKSVPGGFTGRSRPVRYQLTSDDPRVRGGGFSHMLRGFNIHPGVFTGLMTAIILVCIFAAIGLFPWPRRLRGQKLGDAPTEPFWRSAIWLGAWLVVPTYIFYCMTMRDYAQPKQWAQAAWSYAPAPWWVIVAGIVVACALVMSWKYVAKFAAWYAVAMVVAIFVWAAISVGIFGIFAKTPGASWWRIGSYGLSDEWWRVPRDWGAAAAAIFTKPYILLIGAILLPALAWHYCGSTLRERATRTLQFILVLGVVYGLAVLVFMVMHRWPPAIQGLVWNARYIGIIFPAIAIALAGLVMRLPTRGLRWFAIAVILGTNLAQAYGRMFLGSEPRLDIMSADIVAADSPNSTVRTFAMSPQPASAHPAGGSVYTIPGRYYLSIATGRPIRPHEFRDGGANVVNSKLALKRILFYTGPAAVAADARVSPNLQRIITWDRLIERPAKDTDDDVLKALGPGWEKIREDFYPVRYHWNWSDLYVARRREFVRIVPAH